MSPFSPGSRVSVVPVLLLLLLLLLLPILLVLPPPLPPPCVFFSLYTCHTYQFLTSVTLPVLQKKDMVLLFYFLFCSPLSFIAHQPPYSARVDSSCSILGPLTPPSSSSVVRTSTFCPDPCFVVHILQCFLPLLLPPTLSFLLLSSGLLVLHPLSLRHHRGGNLDDATLVLVLLPDLIPDMLHLFSFYFDRLLTLTSLTVLQGRAMVLLLLCVSAVLCRSLRINPLNQRESALAVLF